MFFLTDDCIHITRLETGWHVCYAGFMISVIIPTLNAQEGLGATLTALVPACVEGLVREVIIVDGGSSDASLQIAHEAGAKVIACAKGRGAQLAQGGREAKGPWLLFLHADTILEPRWSVDVEQFITLFDGDRSGAAAFRFALNDDGFMPRLMGVMVGLRSSILKLPYGDQGLFIKKNFYDELGGFADLPVMEDVEFIRRIGAKRTHILPAKAHTSAVRYKNDGYGRRIVLNLTCLLFYFAGVSPQKIAERYERGHNARL